MKLIGLTGSIAAGKSEVARILRQLQIPVFDADATVHEIYEDGTAAKHLMAICPDAIEGHLVNRHKLSLMIKSDPSLLPKIEAVIHPLIRAKENEFIAVAKHQHQDMVVIDSPLLIEIGHHKDMDFVILVEADYAVRRARALQRPGMSPEKFEFITAKQVPAADKRRYADHVIDNNGSLPDLEAKTKGIIETIKAQPHHA